MSILTGTTPGPWRVYIPDDWNGIGPEKYSVDGPPSDYMFLHKKEDAILIAAAPALAADNERLQAYLLDEEKTSEKYKRENERLREALAGLITPAKMYKNDGDIMLDKAIAGAEAALRREPWASK